MDLRTALAAALGVGLGLLLVAYPDVVLRVHTVGRLPPGRHGEYGEDARPSAGPRRVVRALGLFSILLGVFFATRMLG